MDTIIQRSELPFIDTCSACGDNNYQETQSQGSNFCDNSCPANNNDNSCPANNNDNSCQACILPQAIDNSVVGGSGVVISDSSAVSPVINNVPINIHRRPAPGPGCSNGVLYVDQYCGNDNTAAPQNSLRKFNTLDAAIEAASSGDKIQVAPGEYTWGANVREKNLIIEASGESTSITTNGVAVRGSRVDLIGSRLGVGRAGFDLQSAELNLSDDIIDTNSYVVKADANSSFSLVDSKVKSTANNLFVASKYSVGRVNNNFVTLENTSVANATCPPVTQATLYDVTDDAEVGSYGLHQFTRNSIAWLGGRSTDVTLLRLRHRVTPNLVDSKVAVDVTGNTYDSTGAGAASYTLLDLSGYGDNDVSATVAGNTWTGTAVSSVAFKDLVAGTNAQRYTANVSGNTFSSNGLVFAKDAQGRYADVKADSSKTLDTSYDGRTWYARKSLVSTPTDVADLTAQHVMYLEGAGARTETLPYVQVTPSVDNNYPGRNLMLSNFSNSTMKFRAAMGNSIATSGKVYSTQQQHQVTKTCGCGNTCKTGCKDTCNGCPRPVTAVTTVGSYITNPPTEAVNNAYYLYLGPKTSMLLAGVNGSWYKVPHFV